MSTPKPVDPPDQDNNELVGLEDDPQWGVVLDELDGELPTRVTAMEFDDEWTRSSDD
ncbi:MAG: hypothetical protein AAFY60_06070 [Myxococcota bacterium]